MASSSEMSTSTNHIQVLRGLLLPGLISAIALSVAYVGALIIGKDSGIDGVNGFVESLSGGSSSILGDLGLLAPLGFAFAAGMASAVNPCGFAMLPAYLGLYLGDGEQGDETVKTGRRLGKALLVGGSVTAGFIVLFGTTGTVINLGARTIVVGILPWLGLAIGIALAIAGSWMVGGGKLYSGIAAQAASRIGDPSQASPKGYFLFGLSYGTASLSCTLPIFLAVVGISSFAVSSLLVSLGQFLLYGLGMGVVILALTIGMAFAKGAMVKSVRKALPYIQPIGSWLMVIAGAYIVFYWLTIGGLL
jgi:cytochrome c biogenesis protein CcdA